MKEEDTSMETAPLPPPPPPPPPEDDDDTGSVHSNEKQSLLPQKNKKVDFREILALFHVEQPQDKADETMWEQLWQSALVDAREEYAQQLIENKKRKAPPLSVTGVGGRLNAAGGSGPEFAKRLRQTMTSESGDAGKLNRLNRPPAGRPKGGSKLMQKLSSTRGS